MTEPRAISVRLLLDTLARLHCAAEAMGIQVADIELEAFSDADQARWACRSAEAFRAWINGEEQPRFSLADPNPTHRKLTGRPHPGGHQLRVVERPA